MNTIPKGIKRTIVSFWPQEPDHIMTQYASETQQHDPFCPLCWEELWKDKRKPYFFVWHPDPFDPNIDTRICLDCDKKL